MVLTALIATYLLLLLGVVFLKIRSRDFFETVPSLLWAVMMVIPFWLDRNAFAANFPESTQAYGVLGVAFALLIADGWAVRRVQLVGTMPSSALTLSAHCLFIVFGGLQVLHIAQLEDSINLLSWIRGEGVEYFTVSSELVWYQMVLTIGAPVTLAVLLRARSYSMGIAFFVLSLFYAFNVSVWLFVIFLALGPMLLTQELARVFSRKLWGALTVLAFLPLLISWILLDKDQFSALSTRLSGSQIQALTEEGLYRSNGFSTLTQGDHFRLLSSTSNYQERLTPASKAYNDFLATVFRAQQIPPAKK